MNDELEQNLVMCNMPQALRFVALLRQALEDITRRSVHKLHIAEGGACRKCCKGGASARKCIRIVLPRWLLLALPAARLVRERSVLAGRGALAVLAEGQPGIVRAPHTFPNAHERLHRTLYGYGL